MRLFVIGNSHVASLKQGWDLVSREFADIELVFFAHRGEKIGALRARGNSLVPPNDDLKNAISFTSGGRDRIDLTEPDQVLLYGMGLRIPRPEPIFYSSAARDQACRDSAQKTICYRLLRRLRSVSDVPVLIGHDPLPARETDEPGTGSEYVQAVARMGEVVFSPLGAELVTQPLSTLGAGFQTAPAYTAHSTRLRVGGRRDGEQHPERDIRHMNGEFGALYLLELLARLRRGALAEA